MKKMNKQILIAGFGGQGILFSGKFLAYEGLIDGKEVSVLMKQEIKEYLSADEYCNAYLLTVEKTEQSQTDLPYRTFKVELIDLENGDRGEGVYYMELEDYNAHC